MGYLADYDHDLFVSYAHGDKLTPWAKALCGEVAETLNDLLDVKGDNSVNIWMDDELLGNRSLQQLQERIEKSAILLAVVSKLYLESDWCQQEAKWFAEVCKKRGASDGRLFIVEYRETDVKEWPSFLKDDLGAARSNFKFYSRDRNAVSDPFPFGYPVPKDAPEQSRSDFLAQVRSLVGAMVKEMRRMANVPPPPPVAPPAGVPATAISGGRILRTGTTAPAAQDGKPSVYLAVATEDVAPEQEALRAKLGEAGFCVLPPPDQNHPAAAQACLSALPSGCSHAAMVLGALPGRSTPIEGEDLVIWQYDQISRQGLKLIAWQPRPLELAQIRDAKYRAFVEKLQPSREADADKIAAQVTAQIKAPTSAANGTSRKVFLDAPDSVETSSDVSQADSKLRAILGDLKVLVLPFKRNRPVAADLSARERFRKDARDLKASCDGVVLLAKADDLQPEYWWLELARDVIPKASHPLRCAVVDASANGELGPIEGVQVFRYSSPSLRAELEQWLA